MCVVSNIGDGYHRNFPKQWPNVYPTSVPGVYPTTPFKLTPPVTREEFDKLKREVEALRELLQAARKYDEATGQPDCHMDEKVDFIKKLAEMLGVDMAGVFD